MKWLRGGLAHNQCYVLQPNNSTMHAPYLNDKFQKYHNDSLLSTVWKYNKCSARILRDCTLLTKIKYVYKQLFLSSKGACDIIYGRRRP